jgi:anti-sigma28 factor (negative regulator of flagellin synthesis)
MKVNNLIVAQSGGPPPQPAGPAAEVHVAEAIPVDRVSLNQGGPTKATIEGGVKMAATERSERLHHLAQAVRSGSYRPNASQLAEQLVAEAKFDARLAKALR